MKRLLLIVAVCSSFTFASAQGINTKESTEQPPENKKGISSATLNLKCSQDQNVTISTKGGVYARANCSSQPKKKSQPPKQKPEAPPKVAIDPVTEMEAGEIEMLNAQINALGVLSKQLENDNKTLKEKLKELEDSCSSPKK